LRNVELLRFRPEYTRKDSPEHTQTCAALTLSAARELYAHTLVHVLAQIQHSALLVPRLPHSETSQPPLVNTSRASTARRAHTVATQWWNFVLWTLCLCLTPITIQSSAGEGFPAKDHLYHICAAPQTSSEQRGCCLDCINTAESACECHYHFADSAMPRSVLALPLYKVASSSPSTPLSLGFTHGWFRRQG